MLLFLLRRGLPQHALFLLWIIGSVPQQSEGLKCFSCEGPWCVYPSDWYVEECDANVKACFKSGQYETLTRGCASKHLLNYFRNTAVREKNQNCFLCSGDHPDRAKKWCYNFGDFEEREPMLQQFMLDATTCVCYDDLCNTGNTFRRMVFGNYRKGRCGRRTFQKFLEEATLPNELIQRGPDHYRNPEYTKEWCGRKTPPPPTVEWKITIEMALALYFLGGVLIAIVLSCLCH